MSICLTSWQLRELKLKVRFRLNSYMCKLQIVSSRRQISLWWNRDIYVYIYIYIYIIVEKSPNSSHMYDRGFLDNAMT